MPREVFAEEIERFLATLDGVVSARVFTTPAGDIAQVYVTAENAADPRVVRRGVATALVSTYGLPVEPWRILVTQFRSGLQPSEIPRFRVMRVEESLSATEMTACVQVTWMRGGEERSATGRARGPSGPASRHRTLAAATVEAVRDALEPAHRSVSVQQAAVVTFLDRPVVLVGIAVATPRGPESCIGAAPHEEMPEAAVAATLDAVTRWLLQSAFSGAAPHPADRRARLEANRHFVRSGERGGVGSFPDRADGVAHATGPDEIPEEDAEAPEPASPEPPAEVAAAVATAAEARDGAHALPDDVARARPGDTAGPGPEGEAAAAAKTLERAPGELRAATAGAAAVEQTSEDPDVLTDLSQIRPEKRGGTAMSVHQEPSRAGLVPPRTGRPSMEETFYQSLVDGQTPVHLRCRDGYELPHATVKDVGTYTLLIETAVGTELVYKHAIISIRVLPRQGPEA